jgi:hypothetical protein
VESCGCSKVCRKGAREYVMAEIGKRAVPIRCPSCLADGRTIEVDQVSKPCTLPSSRVFSGL